MRIWNKSNYLSTIETKPVTALVYDVDCDEYIRIASHSASFFGTYFTKGKEYKALIRITKNGENVYPENGYMEISETSTSVKFPELKIKASAGDVIRFEMTSAEPITKEKEDNIGIMWNPSIYVSPYDSLYTDSEDICNELTHFMDGYFKSLASQTMTATDSLSMAIENSKRSKYGVYTALDSIYSTGVIPSGSDSVWKYATAQGIYAGFDISITENTQKATYLGLFKGRNMSFAAGVTSVEKNENTTVFTGKNLHLNLNVTNIIDSNIEFCLKYNIMDYYNTCVDAAVFYANKLDAGKESNHNIKLELPKYGMYYLNLYVVCGDDEYRECYPFCMLEEYEHKYRDENPFGICLTHTTSEGQARSTLSILDKMGLSLMRGARGVDLNWMRNLAREEYGIKRFADGVTWNRTAEGVGKWKESVRNHLKAHPDTTYFLMANEVDSPCKANYEKSKKFLNETFKPYTFDPAYEVIVEEFPDKLPAAIWQSNCHGTTEWLEAFYDTGMWDNSEFIDIHTYSSPSGPDKLFSNTRISMHANTFSNEYAMDRWKRIKKRYGEKRMIVGETGYPTAPYIGDRAEVDPRTAADFNVRIACFLLEAGCEDILYYCIYDRTSFFIGTSSWNEMYFGAMYNYDYNGVYMPKPWTAAYCNLTRRFDGFKKVSFFDKYEESEFGTLRAFKVEKEDGDFAVLWSNVYKQPNTTAEGRMVHEERIPMPLWANRWVETEIREFDALGDTVTVIDVMGNVKEIKAENGKVKLQISGSPIYVYGIC